MGAIVRARRASGATRPGDRYQLPRGGPGGLVSAWPRAPVTASVTASVTAARWVWWVWWSMRRGELSATNTAMDFSGRKVLITGGTKGIGAVIARAFLGAGADVVVCGRNEPAQGTLPAAGGRTARFLPADIRDANAAAELVERSAELLGGLDVLVNN